MSDTDLVEDRKARARAWFEDLRDRICAAFEAIEDALSYAFKMLIEEEARGREFECAVLEYPEGDRPLASPLAEIKPKEGWYDYEAKYAPGGSRHLMPAPMPEKEPDHFYVIWAFEVL